jgi:hypothetical protein
MLINTKQWEITNNQDTNIKQIPIFNNQSPNIKSSGYVVWLLEFDYWLLFGYCFLCLGYFIKCFLI